MSSIKKLLIQWNMLFAELVLLAGVFHFSQLQSEGASVNYLPWLLSLSFSLLTNTLLRTWQAPVNLVLIYNGILACTTGILGQQSLILVEENFFVRAFFFLLLAATTAHAASLVEEEPKQRQLVLYLDILVIAAILLNILQQLEALTGIDTLIPLCYLACVGILVSLILSRLQLPEHMDVKAHRFRGSLLLLAFTLLLFAVAWWAASHSQLASAGIVHAAVGVKNMLVGILLFLLQIWGRFFSWLIQLFPAAEEEFLLPEAQPDLSMEEISMEASTSGGFWLLILLIAAIVSGLLLLLWRMRGKRWKKRTASVTATGNIHRNSHWQNGLLLLWNKLWKNIHFQICYLKNRKTAAGLFVWTERKLRRCKKLRGTGESPSDWLRRLAGESSNLSSDKVSSTGAASQVTSDSLNPQPLLTLADLLEKQYYRRTPELLPNGFYRLYRQTISRMFFNSTK